MTLLAPVVPSSAGPTTPAIVRNPGGPSYVVSLRGNASGHNWRGRESISFTNLEAAPLSTIWLRLWSNASMNVLLRSRLCAVATAFRNLWRALVDLVRPPRMPDDRNRGQ